MDYEAKFRGKTTEMIQAWSQVFLNLLNNLFQTKGNQVRMGSQKGSKFESFQKFDLNPIFLAEVRWVIFSIRWEN